MEARRACDLPVLALYLDPERLNADPRPHCERTTWSRREETVCLPAAVTVPNHPVPAEPWPRACSHQCKLVVELGLRGVHRRHPRPAFRKPPAITTNRAARFVGTARPRTGCKKPKAMGRTPGLSTKAARPPLISCSPNTNTWRTSEPSHIRKNSSPSASLRVRVALLRSRTAARGGRPGQKVTWLILPVVICLSQRLSHACLSINNFIL